jgi:hypothetical protein
VPWMPVPLTAARRCTTRGMQPQCALCWTLTGYQGIHMHIHTAITSLLRVTHSFHGSARVMAAILTAARRSGDDISVLRGLLSAVADSGLTPLQTAVAFGTLSCVSLLLAAGADATDAAFQRRHSGKQPALEALNADAAGCVPTLALCALQRDVTVGCAIAAALIAAGARCGSRDAAGVTALHHLCAVGSGALVECVLQAEAACGVGVPDDVVNCLAEVMPAYHWRRDASWVTPLALAVWHRNAVAVDALLRLGARVKSTKDDVAAAARWKVRDACLCCV